MQFNKFLPGLLCGLLVLPLLALSFFPAQENRTAFVDVQQLFNQFKGKQELEARLLGQSQQQQLILDSLNLRTQAMSRRLEQQPNNQQLQAALQQSQLLWQQQQQAFAEQYDVQNSQFTTAIWTQINQYVQEYGEEQGYDYIYGTKGDGNLMYASKTKDITDQLTQYINIRYEGS